jgi:predicted phage tail protein
MCWCVVEEIRKLRKEVKKVMSKVTDFAAATKETLDQVITSLNNIVIDEANLAKQIQDLKDQIANGGSSLTPEDQAALDAVTVSATTIAARTKEIADAVPDLPVPPPVV